MKLESPRRELGGAPGNEDSHRPLPPLADSLHTALPTANTALRTASISQRRDASAPTSRFTRTQAVCALITIVSPVVATSAEKTCSGGDTLRAAGLLSLAEAQYEIEIKGGASALACKSGLLQIAEARCVQASELLAMGNREEARKQFKSLLDKMPTLGCARKGLQAAAPADPGCVSADSAYNLGHADEAEAEYARTLQVNPDEPCAKIGLQCVAASRLLESGALEDAKKQYDAVLKAYPYSKCALAGLNAIAGAAKPCLTAQRLREEGRIKEARDAYDALLKIKPDLTCASQGLQEIAPWSLWRGIQAWTDKNVVPGFPFLAALVLLFFAFWSLRGHFGITLTIATIDPGATGVDDKVRNEFLAKLRYQLYRTSRPRPLEAGHLIDGPVAQIALPDLTSVPKDVNQLWDFIAKVVPPRTATLSATLCTDAHGVPGVLIRLVYEPTKEVWGDELILQPHAKPDGSNPQGATAQVPDYDYLAAAAAAWACWAFHAAHKHRGKSCWQMHCRRLRDAFGTNDWHSYRLSQDANRARRAGDSQTAELQVRWALERDPENRLALYNYAATKVFDAAKKQTEYLRIRKCLEKVKELAKRDARKFPLFQKVDPSVAWADFQLGALSFYRGFFCKDDAENCLKDARRAFKRAVTASKSRGVLGEWERFDPLIALATCERALGKTKKAAHFIEGILDAPVLNSHLAYNLACYYSNYAGDSTPDPELEKASHWLEAALVEQPAVKSSYEKDPSLSRLRQFLESRREKIQSAAYRQWQERGQNGKAGDPISDWLAAEASIRRPEPLSEPQREIARWNIVQDFIRRRMRRIH
jgi:tetratricopeptide (TPR) repeat protein